MKNKLLNLIPVIFFIIIGGLILSAGIMSFKSPEPPQSSSRIMTLDGKANVYVIDVRGSQFVVVISNNGNVAISR